MNPRQANPNAHSAGNLDAHVSPPDAARRFYSDGYDDLRIACDRDARWYLACIALEEHRRANIAKRRAKASQRSSKGWKTRRAA